MDHRYPQLAMSPGRFYDVPWAAGSPLLDRETLPPGTTVAQGWRRTEAGPWVFLTPGHPLAAQGWKVHVAALPDDAAEVAAVCWDACRDLSVAVKVLRSRGLVLASQQKYAATVGSGKVVTCYPGPDRLEPLCERLAAELRGRRAPRILGEIRVADAPVYLRYGAIREQWTTGDDGRAVPAVHHGDALVPDVRGRRDRPTPDEPEYVTRLRAAAARAEAAQVLDVTDVRVVHRSNAGGVYRARRPGDGAVVLLKEARHHAGLDVDGTDAVTRLRHELAALRRASGSGVTPEPLDHLVIGDSDFLVMEWIDGVSIAASISRRHPAVRPEPGPDDAGYLRWVERVVGDARDALAALHARGVVHGDVQPANLVDTGERVVLIDLESCSIDGVSATRSVATPGFSSDASATGPEADLRGLDRVRTMLVNPLTPLLHHRPDLERELTRTGLADLRHRVPDLVVPDPGPGTPAPGTPSAGTPVPAGPVPLVAAPGVAALAAGIAGSATPERDDRLFPGDVEQFSAPRGGLGVLFGAAGVLLALSRRGLPLDPAWVGWLARHARVPGPFPRGFGCGAEGVAWALAALGDLEAADEVVDRSVLGDEAAAPARTPWWQHGDAGRALALTTLARLLDRPALGTAAAAVLRGVVDAVRSGDVPDGYRPGLLDGWSGVGLALLAMREDVGHALGEDLAPALGLAALERELAASRLAGSCLLTREGGSLLPYLGRGSAASGLLAAALLGDRTLAAAVRPGLERVAAGVRHSCAQPVAIFGGLLSGRAGLLCVLDVVSGGTDPMLDEHRRRLAWHTVDAATGGVPAAGTAAALVSLGDQNLRCSTDLATGAAGMLVAAGPEPGARLVEILGLAEPAKGVTRIR